MQQKEEKKTFIKKSAALKVLGLKEIWKDVLFFKVNGLTFELGHNVGQVVLQFGVRGELQTHVVVTDSGEGLRRIDAPLVQDAVDAERCRDDRMENMNIDKSTTNRQMSPVLDGAQWILLWFEWSFFKWNRVDTVSLSS